MNLKALSTGTTKYLKNNDNLKPLMILVLPEHKDYIDKYGLSGHYHLLDSIEQKLLSAITEMLEGKDADEATLKRSAEIISAARASSIEKKPDIPDSLRGSGVPDPPKI